MNKLQAIFLKPYYARLRKIDLEILWPQCVAHASTLMEARAAFALHAYNAAEWLILGDAEIERIILSLQP